MHALDLIGGDRMPALGLGTWLSDRGEVYQAVRRAIELGYRHFDCAWIYGNETEIGQAIRDAIGGGEVERSELWITSKLWNDAHAPKHVRPALEDSLRALGLDYLDLYLVHWPVAHRHGVTRPATVEEFVSTDDLPLERTWEAMAELPATRLVRNIGVSNFSASKVDRIHERVGVAPAVDQVELHPFLQQRDLLGHLRARGIVATAYAPLGSRGRPATMRRSDEAALLDHPAVQRIAQAHRATPAQVLIAWALQRGTAVIPKSTNPQRLEENLGGASLTLAPDAMASLDALERGQRYVTGEFWCPPGSPYSLESLWG